jgi:hypothetical protein
VKIKCYPTRFLPILPQLIVPSIMMLSTLQPLLLKQVFLHKPGPCVSVPTVIA